MSKLAVWKVTTRSGGSVVLAILTTGVRGDLLEQEVYVDGRYRAAEFVGLVDAIVNLNAKESGRLILTP